MGVIELLFLVVGGLCCLFFGLFGITSISETKIRAALISAGLFIIFSSIWFGGFLLFNPSPVFLIIPVAVTSLFTLLFFIPWGQRKYLYIGIITERVDERDVVFAREEYHPGTAKYETYYALRPEYKQLDDEIRKLPELLASGGCYYDPARSNYVESVFKVIKQLTHAVDGEISSVKMENRPVEITRIVKKVVRQLGADDVGIAELSPDFVYSHVGRGPEPWGTPINNNHHFAIVFTMEMDYRNVQKAPALSINEESALKYLKGSVISIVLAELIRRLGYPARAHIAGSNYQIMLPPVAHDAGLGELGRLGY